MPLTDARIRAAKAQQKRHRVSDGHGLSVEITTAAGKYWRYRYELGGKEHLYAMGEWATAPDGETAEQSEARRAAGRLTLAEARLERQRCRDMVRRGQHPIAARKAEQQASQQSAANTFEAVAREFVDKRGGEWSDNHRFRFDSFMRRDVLPAIGSLPIKNVSAVAALAVLRKVEERGSTDMASLGRGFIGQAHCRADATGWCHAPRRASRGRRRRPSGRR